MRMPGQHGSMARPGPDGRRRDIERVCESAHRQMPVQDCRSPGVRPSRETPARPAAPGPTIRTCLQQDARGWRTSLGSGNVWVLIVPKLIPSSDAATDFDSMRSHRRRISSSRGDSAGRRRSPAPASGKAPRTHLLEPEVVLLLDAHFVRVMSAARPWPCGARGRCHGETGPRAPPAPGLRGQAG